MFPPKLSTPGTKPEPEVQPAPQQPSAQPTQAGKVAISPEMVAFRMGDEKCGNCEHMGQDSRCSVIDMEVAPDDSCSAFAQREDGASDIEAPEQEMPPQ